MNNMKIRIQTIGSFLDQLKKFLEPENIVIESSIVGCNPLAMEGKTDEQYLKYAGDANLKSNAVLNIKKNLSSMLSRNPAKFCQNYNVQPFGQNMRIKNTSDYIVFMNYSATTPVFERDGVVYSDLELSSDFIKALHGNNTYTKRLFPFKEDFNWRYYYDKFIDAVMREYDSSHIIFIKTNSAQWYMEKKELHAFGKRSSQFRNLISEMDNYFIERTRCMVIDEHYNHTPTENLPMAWFPYARMNQAALKCIAKDVTNIIYGINSEKYKFSGAKKGNDFAKQLQLRLSSDTIKQNQTHINRIICDWFTFDDIRKYSEENQFFSNLVKLEKFIDYKNPAYLSDYAVELLADTNTVNSNVNVDLVDLYTRYFKLDINDLIAVYKLYEVSDKKSEYKKIIGNVINNSDCIPVNSATYSKNDNLRILKDYTYLNDAYKNKSNDKMYIRLENNCFLVLDKSSDECIKLSYDKIKTQVDHTNVLNNGLNCHVECADALTYSCDYYVEKARRGLGAKPTYLKFDSQDDFLDSLNYIDYCELLKNERFVFVIGDEELAEPQEYMPITNLTELMDPNTVTVKIDAGLGDQISRYIIGQLIKDFSNRKVIYDNQCRHFNGCEVIKLAKEPIPMLNSMLSERINDVAGSNTFGNIIQKISESSVFASFSPMHDEYKYYNAFYVRKNNSDLITTKIPYMYIDGIIHPYRWIEYFNYNLKDYISFPPLEHDEHIALAKKMRSCDSVVIHIRRGDYIQFYKTRGYKPNYKFYVEAITKLLSIPDYPNKKYFVFSDDLDWCKSHLNEIGLNLIGNSEIIYVEGNKADESFRDMQLMTYGKIMIGGHSGFFDIAVQYNDECEMFLGSDLDLLKTRKNKYDVGRFTESYVVKI